MKEDDRELVNDIVSWSLDLLEHIRRQEQLINQPPEFFIVYGLRKPQQEEQQESILLVPCFIYSSQLLLA